MGLFQEMCLGIYRMDSSNDESDERSNATVWRRRGGRRRAYAHPGSPEHDEGPQVIIFCSSIDYFSRYLHLPTNEVVIQ